MLTRWDPLREMLSLRSQMDRLLNDWISPSGSWTSEEQGGWQHLPLDVSESNDAFIVRASLPGVTPEQLDISVQNNMLTIRAETKNEMERENERWHLRERRFGQFQRTIGLPSNVDPNQVGAMYENGVLTLTLPKSEGAKPRKINVQSGSQQRTGHQDGGQQNRGQPQSMAQQSNGGQAAAER